MGFAGRGFVVFIPAIRWGLVVVDRCLLSGHHGAAAAYAIECRSPDPPIALDALDFLPLLRSEYSVIRVVAMSHMNRWQPQDGTKPSRERRT